jgi:hypothetical protein
MSSLLILALSFVSFINLAETKIWALQNTQHQDFKEVLRPLFEQKKKALKHQNPHEFIPKGYVIYEEMYGDLNKDGIEDCVLIIKGPDKNEIIEDENRGELDRNRRGIIVLLKKKEYYEMAIINDNCFSSEHEDGGVYFAPELFIEIDRGKLYVNYLHGRYGYWKYTFSLDKSDFKLIGYDQSDQFGPIISREININFISQKKLEKVNVNENAEGGDEIFKKTKQKIKVLQPIYLSQIIDFHDLDMTVY